MQGIILNDKYLMIAYEMHPAQTSCTVASIRAAGPKYQEVAVARYPADKVESFVAKVDYMVGGKYATWVHTSTGPVAMGGNWTITPDCWLNSVSKGDRSTAVVAADNTLIFLNLDGGSAKWEMIPSF